MFIIHSEDLVLVWLSAEFQDCVVAEAASTYLSCMLMGALFWLLQHCDAFAAGGPATQTGGSVFGRDFQLATALVLEELLTITIYVPADGRL